VGLIGSGERTIVTAGVARLDTLRAFDAATLFQMGSITKVYTASLILQAVERRELALHARVVDVLPGFRLAEGSELVTVFHLLTHSSGLPEAHQIDTGTGDDCLERYVVALPGVRLDFLPGERSAYSNANYVLLGRIIELLYGATWDDALRSELLEPAGLRSTITRSEQLAGLPTTLGYIPNADGVPSIPAWGGSRCYAPAGSTPCTTMDDLLSFASVHLSQGRSHNGEVILSPRSVAEMQVIRSDAIDYGAPARLRPTGVGLGWLRFLHGERDWIGHDGGSAGQMTFLRLNTNDGVAFAVYANAGTGFRVFEDLAEDIAVSLASG